MRFQCKWQPHGMALDTTNSLKSPPFYSIGSNSFAHSALSSSSSIVSVNPHLNTYISYSKLRIKNDTRPREREREREAATRQPIIQFWSESTQLSIQLTACVATCLLLPHNIHIYRTLCVCMQRIHFDNEWTNICRARWLTMAFSKFSEEENFIILC